MTTEPFEADIHKKALQLSVSARKVPERDWSVQDFIARAPREEAIEGSST